MQGFFNKYVDRQRDTRRPNHAAVMLFMQIKGECKTRPHVQLSTFVKKAYGEVKILANYIFHA
jgi:hypothetical protein